MDIGVEAYKLMDLFRWHAGPQSIQATQNGRIRKAATDELADVVICALAFANRTGIDIAQAVKNKVLKNAKKYPLYTYKGRF